MTPQTFEQFVADNKLMLYKIQAKLGAVGDDEVYAEILIGAWRGFVTYQPDRGAKLTTYVYQCAKNAGLTYKKKMHTIKYRDLRIDDDDTYIELEDETTPDIIKDMHLAKTLEIIDDFVEILIEDARGAKKKILKAWKYETRYNGNKMDLERLTGTTYAYCYTCLREARKQIREHLDLIGTPYDGLFSSQ